MDYKDKYEQALKRAKEIYTGSYKPEVALTIAETFIKVFPELKESKDEGIRKALIRAFESLNTIKFWNGIERTDILSWLEKQKPIDENEFAKGVLIRIAMSIMQWLDANLAEGNMCLSNMECEDLENAVRNADWQKVYGYMKKKLEKQGNKPQGKSALEAAKEEKVDNANKIEIKPKFKVGDWIIRSAEGFKHNTYLVTEVKDYYVCEELKGRRVTFTFNDVNKNFKLWDISDAKDGDVLFIEVDGSICIFKKLEVNSLYSYIISDGKLLVEDSHYYYETSDNIHPATKEQKDFLFKRMEEEGYKWDDEHKELKKVETIDTYYKEHCKGYADHRLQS